MKRFVIYALCCIAAALLLFTQAARAGRAEHRLAETYQAALDEACETLDLLELSLDKLLVSGDGAMQASLLGQITVAGASVAHSLATLPVDHSALAQTMAFANRVSDYADALLPGLASGSPLGAEDRAQLAEERAACARLAGEMVLARQAIAFSAAAFTLADGPVAYPAMTYDGRYGAEARRSVQRDEPDVSPEDAERLALSLFPPERTRRAAYQQTGGLPHAHLVELELDDGVYDAAFTVQGGHPLWLTPRQAAAAGPLDDDACRRAADAFLAHAGFESLEPVWQERSGGLCVLTYAALQDGVVLYADLVRVQVRTDTGEAVGLDAASYWRCHETRTLPAPALTAGEAAARLLPEAQVADARLCLLPLHGREVLCHEFRVTQNADAYLIFLDASTGREVLIRKLIPTGGGVRPA